MKKRACMVAALIAASFNSYVIANEINLGIVGSFNTSKQIGNNQCVVDFLNKELNTKVNIRNASDYNSIIQGFLGNKIDLVINMPPKAFAEVYLSDENAIELVGITADNQDNSIGYHSVIIVDADAPYQSIDDLKGGSFAFADPNSTSGYLIPGNELGNYLGGDIDNRFNNHFNSVTFSGGHEQNIVGVLNGQYDAAVTWSSLVGDPNAGYSAGALKVMMDFDKELMNKIKIIWQSPVIPNGPIAINGKLDVETKSKLAKAILKLDKQDNDCFGQASGGDLHIKDVSIKDYQPIIDLVKKSKVVVR